LTVTAQVSDLVPSATLVAVMVAVPSSTAVTRPVELTVATSGALLVQVTAWLAIEGITLAESCRVSLMSRVAVRRTRI